MTDWAFWSIWVLLGGAMFFYYMRRLHRVRSFLAGTFSGLTGLILLHYFGGFFGYCPALNGLNLMQASILGVPGVVMLTVLHFVL